MKTLSGTLTAALAARRLRARDYLWITARDFTTGDPVSVGFWSGLRDVTGVQVYDARTGIATARNFYGAGGLISIGAIPAVVGFTAARINVRMSQLDEQVEAAIRGYDVKMAEVQIYRGLFDPDTAALVEPASCRFFGFVDELKIITGSENEVGYADLTCANHTLELFRANPATRSHADQIARHAGDAFFKDADTVGKWGPMQWGPKQESVDSKAQKKGLLGLGNFLGFL